MATLAQSSRPARRMSSQLGHRALRLARGLTGCTWIVACLLLAICSPAALHAADNANRTLFGNQAIRNELQLTQQQQEKIDAILAEMEQEIADKLAAAKKAAPDNVDEQEIVGAVVAKYGPRAQAELDDKQALLLWQIGAQASGAEVFGNNRTRRLLRFTPDQLRQMQAFSEKMAQNVTRAATDVSKDIPTIQAEVEREKSLFYDNCLALLTPQQRKDFDDLLGKPFDLDLLSNAAGKARRSLTFIFGLTSQNPYCLLADPQIRKALDLSAEQNKKLQPLLKQDDQRLTAVRLTALKKHDADFADLSEDEKQRVAQSILDGAADVFRETNAEVTKLLTEKQVAQLDRRLVSVIGARALGSERIARQLELTAQQQLAFVKATVEFEQKTAVMRVVRSQRAFDSRQFDEQVESLESTARALLTPAQLKKLDLLTRATAEP